MDWIAVRAKLRSLENAVGGAADDEYRAGVLRDRARALARPATHLRALNHQEMLLVFRVGSGRYGIFLEDVSEVIARATPAWVPGAPAVVAGIVQSQGNVIPVYRLTELLGQREQPGTAGAVLILRGSDHVFGLLADEVEEIRTVDPDDSRAVPGAAGFAQRMTQDHILLLESKALGRALSREKEG